MIVQKHIHVLYRQQWATGGAAVPGAYFRWPMRIGPEGPQHQSARTRADQLELPVPPDPTNNRRMCLSQSRIIWRLPDLQTLARLPRSR